MENTPQDSESVSDLPKAMLTKLLSPENRPLLNAHEEIALDELNQIYSSVSYLPSCSTVDPLQSFEEELKRNYAANMRPLARRTFSLISLRIILLLFWTIGVPWASSTKPTNEYVHAPSEGAETALIVLFISSFSLEVLTLLGAFLPAFTHSVSVNTEEVVTQAIRREEDDLKLAITSELEKIAKRIYKGEIAGPGPVPGSEMNTPSDSILSLSLRCSDLRSRALLFTPKTYTRSTLLEAKRDQDSTKEAVYYIQIVQSFSLALTLIVAIMTAFSPGLGMLVIAVIALTARLASGRSSGCLGHSFTSPPSGYSLANATELDSLA